MNVVSILFELSFFYFLESFIENIQDCLQSDTLEICKRKIFELTSFGVVELMTSYFNYVSDQACWPSPSTMQCLSELLTSLDYPQT